jgi:glycosyltransferase involved in cell wall biosynthesis
MKKPKLLIITNRYPAHRDDGASPFVSDFVRGMFRNGVSVTVLTPRHAASKYEKSEYVHRFDWGEDDRVIGSLPMFNPVSLMKIRQYFRAGVNSGRRLHESNRFDFCLALWAAPSGIFARHLKREYGLPYAVWCLGSDIHTYARLPLIGNFIVDVLCGAERVYSDGHQLGRDAQRLSGCPYHFLPTMRRIENAESYTKEIVTKTIVCIGRVAKAKGVFDLLEAFEKTAGRYREWSLHFIGDGPDLPALKDRIQKAKLGDRVTASGFVSRSKLFSALAKAAAIAIPSHADSLPLVFGEAMQLKRPVLVSEVGDLELFTRKYGVGEAFPAKQPRKLSLALEKAMSGDLQVDETGFERCARELDCDSAADRFANWLKSFLTQTSTRQTVAAV